MAVVKCLGNFCCPGRQNDATSSLVGGGFRRQRIPMTCLIGTYLGLGDAAFVFTYLAHTVHNTVVGIWIVKVGGLRYYCR